MRKLTMKQYLRNLELLLRIIDKTKLIKLKSELSTRLLPNAHRQTAVDSSPVDNVTLASRDLVSLYQVIFGETLWLFAITSGGSWLWFVRVLQLLPKEIYKEIKSMRLSTGARSVMTYEISLPTIHLGNLSILQSCRDMLWDERLVYLCSYEHTSQN